MDGTTQRLALLGVLAGLAAAVSGVALRRRRRAGAAPGAPAPRQEFTCTCGRPYRMTGEGRHRVVWPREAPEGSPVLEDACPDCGTPFPASRVAA
jgi:hypothetical protein